MLVPWVSTRPTICTLRSRLRSWPGVSATACKQHLSVAALLTPMPRCIPADRAAFYADPDKHNALGDDELGEVWERLASKEYGRRQARRVDMATAATEVGKGSPSGQADAVNRGEGDTIYSAFADEEGMMVSWIQSNYGGFGSKLAAPGTGFALQNRGSLFALQPDSHPNICELTPAAESLPGSLHGPEPASEGAAGRADRPGKRPFHTIVRE